MLRDPGQNGIRRVLSQDKAVLTQLLAVAKIDHPLGHYLVDFDERVVLLVSLILLSERCARLHVVALLDHLMVLVIVRLHVAVDICRRLDPVWDRRRPDVANLRNLLAVLPRAKEPLTVNRPHLNWLLLVKRWAGLQQSTLA